MDALPGGSPVTTGGPAGGVEAGTAAGLGSRGNGPGADGHGGGTFEGAFGAGNGPAFARHVQPEYPPQARRFGREGVVVLRLCIDATGNLTQAEVVERAGSGFDEAALTSVKASSYRPAVRDGQAIPSRAVLRIRFQLAGQ